MLLHHGWCVYTCCIQSPGGRIITLQQQSIYIATPTLTNSSSVYGVVLIACIFPSSHCIPTHTIAYQHIPLHTNTQPWRTITQIKPDNPDLWWRKISVAPGQQAISLYTRRLRLGFLDLQVEAHTSVHCRASLNWRYVVVVWWCRGGSVVVVCFCVGKCFGVLVYEIVL